MAYTYLSFADARLSFDGYLVKKALAEVAGDELLIGAENEPGPTPSIPDGHPSTSYRVEIGARDASSHTRWREALNKAEQLGQQVVIVGA